MLPKIAFQRGCRVTRAAKFWLLYTVCLQMCFQSVCMDGCIVTLVASMTLHLFICMVFLHCVFSNDYSNFGPARKHTCIGCICMIFLQCIVFNCCLIELCLKKALSQRLHLWTFLSFVLMLWWSSLQNPCSITAIVKLKEYDPMQSATSMNDSSLFNAFYTLIYFRTRRPMAIRKCDSIKHYQVSSVDDNATSAIPSWFILWFYVADRGQLL